MKAFDNSFEPEVGKYYLVQCARYKHAYLEDVDVCTVPVIGEAHNDKQFGVNEDHYHIDGRFTTRKENNLFNINGGYTNAIIGVNTTKFVRVFIEIVYEKRKCKRTTTGILPPRHAKAYWDWRSSMTGKKVKDGICPHRGVKMHDKGDVLVCPLHGLVACKKKNEIIELESL